VPAIPRVLRVRSFEFTGAQENWNHMGVTGRSDPNIEMSKICRRAFLI